MTVYTQLWAMLAACCGTSEEELRQADDLIESGLLDSLSRIEWLTAVENAFGTVLQPTQMPPAVWRSAASLITYTQEHIQKNDRPG